MNAELTTTPVIEELCTVLHIADQQGDWPEEQPIAELAHSYVEAMAREVKSEFDLYQMKQQALGEQLDGLLDKLAHLKAQIATIEENSDSASPQSPELRRDTFTPDEHRSLLDRCLKSIQKLS